MTVDVQSHPKHLSRPVAIIGRIGYLSKGLVYILIGVLALLLAIGVRKSASDSSGALYVLADTWYGKTLVALIGVGLLFFATWKFVELCYDPKHKGAGVKGIFSRLGAGISVLLSLLLAIQAFYIAGVASKGSGSSSSGSGSQKNDWTAELMETNGGRIVVIIVGAIILVQGVYHGYRAVTDKFLSELDTTVMSKDEIKYAKHIGRFGYLAWCINAILIVSFIIAAAVQSDANDASNAGFSKTIRTLQGRAYGRFLLGLFAIWVIGYGLFHFFMARFSPVFTYNSKRHHHHQHQGDVIAGPDAV